MDNPGHHQLLRSLDLLLDAVFLVAADGHILYASAACETIFGYTPAEMSGTHMIDLVLPEDKEKTLQEAARVMAGHPRIGFENRYLRKDGSTVHVMWSAHWSAAEQLRIGVARNVTAQKQAEALQGATYAVSEAVHNAPDLDALFHQIHAIIAGLVPLAGLAVATREGQDGKLALAYRQDAGGAELALDTAATHRHCAQVIGSHSPLVLQDESLTPASGRGAHSPPEDCWLIMPLISQHEAIGALVLKAPPDVRYTDKDRELFQFVSAQVATAIERVQLKAELVRAAQYDELTSLPNRRLFHDRMATALVRCRRRQGRMALLYIDLDDFKQVNDCFGHAIGDQLLKQVARRLERCVRKADTVARLGGDEFVVILEDIQAPEDATTVATKIHASLAQAVPIAGRALHTHASIGIALYPQDGVEADQLLRHADTHMYQDKNDKPFLPR
ncbi:diguanylate cyclase [Zoogloea sp.]|uniref:sensor domain-containing protein n=1 Tax=Zoogloea sp. TaxID=49181 RepID=UPI002615C882|nr:diguanylate cyclase [Zoogloea sp.]MDD3354242.1 diguanylate cyclase [Zoogloea sp.]